MNARYNGKRYIDKSNDEFQSIDGFTLIDLHLQKSFAIQKMKWSVSAHVNNIMDIYYEQLKNHAMPGRNYSINLTFKL